MTSLPPLLLQLAAEGASDTTLQAEGFNRWEISAAKAIVARARSSSTRRAGDTSSSSSAVTVAGRQ